MAPAHFLRDGRERTLAQKVDRAAVLSLRTAIKPRSRGSDRDRLPAHPTPHEADGSGASPRTHRHLDGFAYRQSCSSALRVWRQFRASSGQSRSRLLSAISIGLAIPSYWITWAAWSALARSLLKSLRASRMALVSTIGLMLGTGTNRQRMGTRKAPFGRSTYIPLPGFDKSFRKADLQAIAAAAGGRRLVSCQDPTCCAHGLKSMLDNPRAHIAHQKRRAVGALYQVPDSRRIGHFLDVEMREAERKAGDLVRLNLEDDKLRTTLIAGKKRNRQYGKDVRVVGRTGWADRPAHQTSQHRCRGKWTEHPMSQVQTKPVVEFIERLRRTGGLKGTDIANFAGVSKATVSRWATGQKSPHTKTQLIMSDLAYVVMRLSEYYSNEEIRAWLYARHPRLEGARAIDLIHDAFGRDNCYPRPTRRRCLSLSMPDPNGSKSRRSIRDQRLLDALEKVPRAPYAGTVWRSVREGADPLVCWRSGGRWDDRTFDVLYTSESREVAIEGGASSLSRATNPTI